MRSPRLGSTLLEMLISMVIFSMLSASIVITYRMGYSASHQGANKVDAMRTLREAMNRIRPVVSSASPPSATQSAIYEPAAPLPGGNSLQEFAVLSVSKEYTDLQLKGLSETTHLINPVSQDLYLSSRANRTAPLVTYTKVSSATGTAAEQAEASQYQLLRLFFTKTVSPELPGGQRGNLAFDYNTLTSAADDRILCRNLYSCDIGNPGDNTLSITLTIKKFDYQRKRASRGQLQVYQLTNRLFLPYYTNVSGGN